MEAKPPIRFRKLRIAWSVVCGLLCVLLIILWVRSYWWSDVFTFPKSSQRTLGIGSTNARIFLGATDDETFPLWTWLAEPNRKPTQYLPWFEVSSRSVSSEVYVPDWWVVILIISVATVPWKRQLRWRFTLRTLLIAMTLVAIGLGLTIYAVRN